MSGHIRFDVDYRMRGDDITPNFGLPNAASNSGGNMGISDGRLNIDRFFGEDESAFFRLRLRFRTGSAGWDDTVGGSEFARGHMYVTIPFIYDTRLTVGYFGDDDIDKYFGFYPDMTGRYADGYGWFNDNQRYMMRLTKSFEFGDFYFGVSHPDDAGAGNNGGTNPPGGGHAWEVITNFNFR